MTDPTLPQRLRDAAFVLALELQQAGATEEARGVLATAERWAVRLEARAWFAAQTVKVAPVGHEEAETVAKDGGRADVDSRGGSALLGCTSGTGDDTSLTHRCRHGALADLCRLCKA